MAAVSSNSWLYRAGKQPFDRSVSDVKQLAEAVWYRGYCPTSEDLEDLWRTVDRQQFQRMLCVLELLSQYPVCQRKTARHLQMLTGQFHERLFGHVEKPTQGRYSPSKRWGLSEKTGALRKALLPLQTRTYADATGRDHGLSA
ncbi:hypothetical protein [Vreelandella subglaciescola]|jgi:hypothetical protein|uniref:Uncharacterized protein n=1 Tax=Vreelandella subglaciescola TaxID=29571 RepID=A0A1M7HAR2_9GAMM|nr:hypothetical protein [Halomonas subglaciescola]SHM25584.1 hypothetical protein SAMN05878437_2010 [Halomonas subglaciescola]